MGTGIQADTSNPRYLTIRLLEAQAGVSAIPTESTAGSVTPLSATPTAAQYFDLRTVGPVRMALRDDWEVFVHNAAGTNPVNCKIQLWAYSIVTGLSYPWGVGAATTRGVLNEGNSIGEADTDKVRHWERIEGPGMADGIMARVTESNGTGSETWTVEVRCPVAQRS